MSPLPGSKLPLKRNFLAGNPGFFHQTCPLGRRLTRSFRPSLLLGQPTHNRSTLQRNANRRPADTGMAGTMDRLEACNSPETSGTAGDALPGPRVYTRRWVFLLVVSLLSCSNAMVQGCWGGQGGVFPAALAPNCFRSGTENRLLFWLEKL